MIIKYYFVQILFFDFKGPLLQIPSEKTKFSRNPLGSFSSSFKEKKEIVRQVFLFTNHILLTTRTSNGRLHLAKVNIEQDCHCSYSFTAFMHFFYLYENSFLFSFLFVFIDFSLDFFPASKELLP